MNAQRATGMEIAAVRGTALAYTTVGTGPTCLLLHGGLGLDHTLYRPAFDQLADRLRLVYFDHRGNGRSGRPSLSTLTMEQFADDANALAEHLSARRVLVIGHSYGGFVAQELALRHPDRVAGLVLVATTPGQLGTAEPDEQGTPPPAELAAAMRSTPRTNAEFADLLSALLPWYLHRLPSAAVEPLLRRSILDVAAWTRSMAVLRTWSSVDRLHRIQVPTLLLVGRHDLFCSPAQSRRIVQRIPGAELVVLEHSGHLPWLEEPEPFFTALGAWLAPGGHRPVGQPQHAPG
jgi:proline iminopeptidase